jgi:hypothetical protein
LHNKRRQKERRGTGQKLARTRWRQNDNINIMMKKQGSDIDLLSRITQYLNIRPSLGEWWPNRKAETVET